MHTKVTLATDSFPSSIRSKTPTQNGSSKNTVSLPLTLSMTIPPIAQIDEQRMDNPEGQVTYPT